MNGAVRLVESVPDAFAELTVERIGEPHEDGFSLFLSGGGTAEECYRRLAERSGASDRSTDWSDVDIYLGDERCVALDDAESNHRMIAEVLLDHIGPVRSDHPMYESGPPDVAATSYQRVVEALGPLDLVHLGLGPDGHCASLFPGSEALAIDDPATLVMVTTDPTGTNPHDRITLTLPAIARARLVVFTVSGASKRPAFERIVAGVDLPAARVTAAEVVWLVDAEAAGRAALPDR
ncbi:MAG: 6-phosphogluconolactonase [Acidimicrobiales bacterium]